MRNKFTRILAIAGGVLLLAFLLYQLPPVHSRLAWRLENLQSTIKSIISPPDKAIFVPGQQTEQFTPTPAALPTATRTPVGATPTLAPSPSPTITPTPLPSAVILPGVIFVDQHNRFNYCGIANLSMALRFWGWEGEEGSTLDMRDQIAAVVKPGVEDPSLDLIFRGRTDVNVMPYELVNYVADRTDYNVLLRYGGDTELLKRLIAAGFPVVAEKGVFAKDIAGKVTWMGHYMFTTGYDDEQGAFIAQDSLPEGDSGKNTHVRYEAFNNGWRAFDYVFYVVYPPEREQELYAALGDWGDPNWAYERALEIADEEVQTMDGLDQYFAWFNKGTSAVNLLQYGEAAEAYDRAFEIYPTLPEEAEGIDSYRPYRMMWYQTGPYKAYYYTGRYQDVIDLANTTLFSIVSAAELEESFYWRGLAKEALGDHVGAASDLRTALHYNKNFTAAYDALAQIQAGP